MPGVIHCMSDTYKELLTSLSINLDNEKYYQLSDRLEWQLRKQFCMQNQKALMGVYI